MAASSKRSVTSAASPADALAKNGQLQARLEAVLSNLEGQPASILLVTDPEALHPYMRIGGIEAQPQRRAPPPMHGWGSLRNCNNRLYLGAKTG